MPVEAVSLYPLVIFEPLARPGPRKVWLIIEPARETIPVGIDRNNSRPIAVQSNLHSPDRRLIELAMEHADLDALIDRAGETTPVDEIMMRRLTKRRLALKDEMARIRNSLSPDEPA